MDTMISGTYVCSELTRAAALREIEVTCFNNASQMNSHAVLQLQDNKWTMDPAFWTPKP